MKIETDQKFYIPLDKVNGLIDRLNTVEGGTAIMVMEEKSIKQDDMVIIGSVIAIDDSPVTNICIIFLSKKMFKKYGRKGGRSIGLKINPDVLFKLAA